MSNRRRGVNQFRKRIDGIWCIYCGDAATTEEHFPPVTVTFRGLILPACRECNAIAGTHCASDFDERCKYVKEVLRAKYSRVLTTPDWSGREIRATGRGLRDGVKAWQKLKDSIKPRLLWDYRIYLNYIDQNDYFAQFMARNGSALRFGREASLVAEAAE